jgi:hypothetical protein
MKGERAIMRARSLTNNKLLFEKGAVNFPPDADRPYSSGYIQSATRYLCMISLVVIFFKPILGIIGLIATVALFAYRKYTDSLHAKSDEHIVEIKDLLNHKPFSVMAYDVPAANEIEEEIREVLSGFKALMTISAQPVMAQKFEI